MTVELDLVVFKFLLAVELLVQTESDSETQWIEQLKVELPQLKEG